MERVLGKLQGVRFLKRSLMKENSVILLGELVLLLFLSRFFSLSRVIDVVICYLIINVT